MGIDADTEARFQELIGGGSSPGANLRDAFAQLMAQNQQSQAVPMEALMAAQGRQQFPPPQPDPTMVRPREMGDSPTTDMPMRALNPGAAADLVFPTAPAGPGSPEAMLPPPPPKPMTDGQRAAAEPFNGQGQVVGPYTPPQKTFDLPRKQGRR